MTEEVEITLVAQATFTETYTVEADEQDYTDAVNRAEDELEHLVHKLSEESEELEESGFYCEVEPGNQRTRDIITDEWLSTF